MNILGTDPLGVLNAMRSVPRQFGNLPGDDYVRDQLAEAWHILGGSEYLFGGYDPEYGRPINAGAAPILPFGAPLRGVVGRMGPSATKGQRLKRQLMSQERRLGQAAIRDFGREVRFYPELSPQQDAFRRYLLERPISPEEGMGRLLHNVRAADSPLERGAIQARAAQRGMLTEEMEDLFPERLARDLMDTMHPQTFSQYLKIVEDTAANARSGGFGRAEGVYEAFADARNRAGLLMADEMENALAAGDLRRAAKIAALRWKFERTAREQMNFRFGGYRSSTLPGGQPPVAKSYPEIGRRMSPEVWKTEGRSWAELKDRALKNAFREIQRRRRDLRDRPDRMH